MLDSGKKDVKLRHESVGSTASSSGWQKEHCHWFIDTIILDRFGEHVAVDTSLLEQREAHPRQVTLEHFTSSESVLPSQCPHLTTFCTTSRLEKQSRQSNYCFKTV